MNGCEDFEVEIEMRLHGALDRPREASLDRHLVSCPSCSAFENLAKGSRGVMVERANTHLQGLDWEDLWSRTKDFIQRDERQRILTAALLAMAITPFLILLNGDPWVSIAVTIAAIVIGGTIRWLVARRKIESLRAYQGDAGELFYLYRRELERKLERRGMWLLPLVLAFVARPFLQHEHTPMQWAGLVGVAVVLTVQIAHALLVKRPRIQRELDALKSEPRR